MVSGTGFKTPTGTRKSRCCALSLLAIGWAARPQRPRISETKMARRGTSPVLFLTFGLVAALAWQSGVGSLPVAAQSASPVAATEETLLEITIPPDLLPQGDRILSELIYITAPGGSTARWQEIHYADWPGLRVHHLLTGNLSVRAEGAAQVVR